MHLERFMRLAENEVLNVGFFDVKKHFLQLRGARYKHPWFVFLFFLRSRIVHIHISNWTKVLIASLARVFGKQVIYTHHNNVIKNYFVFYLMYFLCKKIVFVNGKCIPSRIRHTAGNKWVIIPAFIPPSSQPNLPEELVGALMSSKWVVGFNAYRKTMVHEGEVYGIDLVISVFERFAKDPRFRGLSFVFFDPSGTHADDVAHIRSYNPDGVSFVYRNEETLSFYELLKHCTVSIRPTRTDGDSLSVRESLYLGVPVVASDVVERPKGTIVFSSGCANDLYEKLRFAIENKSSLEASNENFYSGIIELYKEVKGEL